MKPVLILPAGAVSISTGERDFGDHADFDMISFLTNEFENADEPIRATLLEIDPASQPMQMVHLSAELQSLKRAARNVVSCWEGGDLAAAVRRLDELTKEGA